jgi:aldehyde dehydrogenase
MSSTINESLIRDVIEDVLGRLNRAPASSPTQPAPASNPTPAGRNPACGCPTQPAPAIGKISQGRFGVFEDANQACEAAQEAFLQLSAKGVAGRVKVIRIIKELSLANANEWGRIELDETKIGRLDHKIEKLKGLSVVPGVEFLNPLGLSGDHGIALEEFAPFGVIGAVTPSTHSIPTMACNIITMVASGNTAVFNPHPGAARCAATALRVFNQAIHHELGIENLACLVAPPTLESFHAIARSEHVKLLCVTGGPGVVKAAMQSGKRAICAGPGNPPVLVDGTGCLEQAAQCVTFGAAYDNNLLCIGEKQVFILEPFFDQFMNAMTRNGALLLNPSQVDRLTKEAFAFPPGQGAGCPHPVVNRDLVGRDPQVLGRVAGVNVPPHTQLLFAETPADHLFVEEEQMMPFVPVVRVQSVEEGIAAAKTSEHGYKHSAIIHSLNVAHMTAMARALETTLFVKNGSCLAGLGSGGEGYPNFSIATTTGEGICNPRTFTRVRRCVRVDNLRIL